MQVVEWIPYKERWGWRDGQLVIGHEWIYYVSPGEIQNLRITGKNIPIMFEILGSVYPVFRVPIRIMVP